MTRPAQYIATIDDNQSAQHLIDRWRNPTLAKQAEAIRRAIVKGDDLPVDVPMITAHFSGTAIKLADLRGINLSQLVLEEIDLSYCCFESADFTGTRFLGTHIQYSSFENAKLDEATWEDVQASPIFADGASFRNSHIKNSFIMGASLNGANFDDAEIANTALVGSALEKSNLEHANILLALDITEALLTDSSELRHKLRDPIGKAHWKSSVSVTRHPNRSYRSFISDYFEKIYKNIDDISSLAHDVQEFSEMPVVGTVVKKITPFLAEVAVFSTLPQSSFSTHSGILRMSQGSKSTSKEKQTSKRESRVIYPSGKLRTHIYKVEIERDAVSLGDTVQLEKARRLIARNNIEIQTQSTDNSTMSVIMRNPSHELYKVSKIVGKKISQSSSKTRQRAHGIPVEKIRNLAAKSKVR